MRSSRRSRKLAAATAWPHTGYVDRHRHAGNPGLGTQPQAAAHVLEDPEVQAWAKRYKAKMNQEPADYTVTYYDAAMVVIDAIARVSKAGKPMTRENVRDAIQATNLKTCKATSLSMRTATCSPRWYRSTRSSSTTSSCSATSCTSSTTGGGAGGLNP